MPSYTLSLTDEGVLKLYAGPPTGEDYNIFELEFTCANYFDDDVWMKAFLSQTTQSKSIAGLSLELKFVDDNNDDKIYSFKGMLNSDINSYTSIVAVMDAHDDFSDVKLSLYPENMPDDEEDFFDMYLNEDDAPSFNAYDSLGKRFQYLSVPTELLDTVPDLYQTIVRQDVTPSVMYYQMGDNLQDYTALVRVAKKLKIRLIVELPPELTVDQACQLAEDIALDEFGVTFIYAPVVARPIDAAGVKGKKVPRWCGGTLLGRYMRREANKDGNGIPAIHRAIAGYDYPYTYVGLAQNPDVYLGDDELKRLADAKVNVIKREKYANGIRFILEDSLTTYNDNQSILKLCNASDISMFIDKRLIEITKRHVQKHMDGFLEDSLKECTEFLDNCTTKERPLLRQSSVLGGFYVLSITPSNERPDDMFILECAYHPQGTARALLLKTEVTR